MTDHPLETYPPDELTQVYPALIRIPPEERPAWAAQAEAGIELTDEQSTRLGFAPCIRGGLLVACQGQLSASQLDYVFPPSNRRALVDALVALMQQKVS